MRAYVVVLVLVVKLVRTLELSTQVAITTSVRVCLCIRVTSKWYTVSLLVTMEAFHQNLEWEV